MPSGRRWCRPMSCTIRELFAAGGAEAVERLVDDVLAAPDAVPGAGPGHAGAGSGTARPRSRAGGAGGRRAHVVGVRESAPRVLWLDSVGRRPGVGALCSGATRRFRLVVSSGDAEAMCSMDSGSPVRHHLRCSWARCLQRREPDGGAATAMGKLSPCCLQRGAAVVLVLAVFEARRAAAGERDHPRPLDEPGAQLALAKTAPASRATGSAPGRQWPRPSPGGWRGEAASRPRSNLCLP